MNETSPEGANPDQHDDTDTMPPDNEAYVASFNKVMADRVTSMKAMLEAGDNPFANDFKPTHLMGEIAARFADDDGNPDAAAVEAAGEEVVRVAGRIVERRVMGKIAFIRLLDRTGRLQVMIQKNAVGDDAFKSLKKVWDVGDFIGVTGTMVVTRTGELSVRATELHFLTKSLRPLPEKFHGLSDTETRFRQRYVDLVVNDEVRDIFAKRAQIVRLMRRFLDERGFLEVETPMMHQTPGGATAKPFVTHHNALGIDLFMRIAPELYLKRLLVGGLERVYEINRNFRNEGLSRRHNPEFTMLEFYQAYATYEDLMELTEEMVTRIAEEVTGGTTVTWNGMEISFERPWRRLRVRDAVAEACGVSVDELADRATLERLAGELPERPRPDWIANVSPGHLLFEIFEQRCEHTIISPTFVYEYPSSISPLSRRNEDDPEFVDRFEIIVAGMELGNAFSELNDPLDQRQRFLDQLAARAAGEEHVHPMDEDYIRALEVGMPPAAGEGIGIDRLVMLLTGAESIREVILFPQLRPDTSAG